MKEYDKKNVQCHIGIRELINRANWQGLAFGILMRAEQPRTKEFYQIPFANIRSQNIEDLTKSKEDKIRKDVESLVRKTLTKKLTPVIKQEMRTWHKSSTNTEDAHRHLTQRKSKVVKIIDYLFHLAMSTNGLYFESIRDDGNERNKGPDPFAVLGLPATEKITARGIRLHMRKVVSRHVFTRALDATALTMGPTAPTDRAVDIF
ncbi:MAG: hypothetical protein Q9188_002404 [Gyalolechia gomerana]